MRFTNNTDSAAPVATGGDGTTLWLGIASELCLYPALNGLQCSE
jgi:hypothetical protein